MSTAPAKDGNRPLSLRLSLAAILLLALAIRLWGIDWGLPDALHHYSFHPDETTLLEVSLPEFPGGMNLLAGRFLPHYYAYGTLPFTLTSIAVLLGQSYHLIGPLASHGALDSAQLARAYAAARLVSAALGVGTVWAVYALARRCFASDAAGLLGAFFLAVCPLHAQQSHYATVDVGSAFWLTLALVWTVKLLAVEATPALRIRAALLAGVFAGLTAATKYSGVLVLLGAAAALVILVRARQIDPAQASRLGLIACAGCAAAFVLACPGCLLDQAKFLHDVRYESNHVMHQGEVYFQQTGPGWVYIVDRNLDAGMGLPLLLISLAGLAYGCVRRTPGDWLLLAAFVPLYAVLGAAQSRYARYEMPLLPLLVVWAARGCVDCYRALEARGKPIAWGMGTAAALVAAFTAADCAALIEPMTRIDPRERAALWVEEHVPPGSVIGLSGSPWFWTPPLNPDFCLPRPDAWQLGAPASELARYCYNPGQWLDADSLARCNPPVVILTEYQYYDPLRLRQPAAARYLAALRAGYGPPVVFRSAHPLGGMRLLGGLPVQDLPHDMLYPDPTIVVYTRR